MAAKDAPADTADARSAPKPEAKSPVKPAPAKPKTVTVHCAIKNGFVMSFMGGPAAATIESLTIPSDVHKNFTIKLKYGSNPGIDAEKWDRWLSENAEYPAVVSCHIFATEDR